MKKYLLILLVVLMAFTVNCYALDGQFNLATLTDEELISLADQVDEELTKRDIIHRFLYTGIYRVGDEIMPGMYTVSISKVYNIENPNEIGYQIDTWNEERNRWNRDLYVLLNSNSESQKATFTLKDNQRLLVANIELEIIDFK